MKRFLTDNKWPLVIFLAAFFLRLIYLIQSQSNPSFEFPMVDELWHLNWAKEIFSGNFWGDEAYFRGPLYPYFLTVIYKIAGDSIFWTRFLQIIIGSCSAILVYAIGHKMFSRVVGIIAGFAYAAYGTIIFYETMFLIPVLYIFLLLASFYYLILIKNQTDIRAWVQAGICLGLAAIARPNILLLAPLIMLWIYFGFRKLAGGKKYIIPLVYLLGILVPVLSVTARNYVVTGETILISSQGGVNLYIGNNPDTEGLTMLMPEVRLDESISWSQFAVATREAAENETGTKLSASEESSFWTTKAINYVISNPGKFISITFKKLIYFLVGFENSDNADIYFSRNYSSLFSILLWQTPLYFPFGLIFPLAIIGVMAQWKRRSELALLFIMIVGYIPTVILFLVTARHRLPVIPFMLLFSSAGAYALFLLYKSKKWKKLIIYLSIFIVCLNFSNRTYFDIGFQNLSQIHFNQAITYERQNDLQSAKLEYIEALKSNPYSPTILNNLGYIYYRLKIYDSALVYYQKTIQSDPKFSNAYNNAGLTFQARGDLESAEKFFKKAINISPDLYTAYINLGNLYLAKNDLVKAEFTFLQAKESTPDRGLAYFRLGSLYSRQKVFDKAEEMFVTGSQLEKMSAADYVNWGNNYFGNQNPQQAVELYKKAIETEPTFAQAYMNLAITFRRYNFPVDSSKKYLNELLKISPNYQPAREMLQQIGN
ncbi:MAG: tetratricopeptide repeat protein [candidate division Zixibacteria bacterium]|nr:tetratricopeptide repeat protein [candidate division Zixibacteria bacterium]